MSLFNAGQEPTDAQFNSLNAPGWTSYGSIAWSSSGTQPVLNNGTLTGRYRRTTDSDFMIYEFRLVIGSTTTGGTGTYWISVPVTPSATAVLITVGSCYILESGVQDKIGQLKFEDNTKITMVAASGGVVTPTNPIGTLSTGDQFRGVMIYEPA